MLPHKLDHIGVAVRSLDDALPLYRDALGLPAAAVEEVAGMGVRVVKLALGEMTIELIEPTDPAGVIARFLEQRGPGIHHICLAVADVAAATAALHERGYETVYATPRAGADGALVNFLRPQRTGGVLIELSQHAAGSVV